MTYNCCLGGVYVERRHLSRHSTEKVAPGAEGDVLELSVEGTAC
jgi:hypothetical protein